MPSSAAASFLSWLTDHAVFVLAVSVTVTVVLDQATSALRGRSDLRGSALSVLGGTAYLVAKGIVSKGVFFGVALAVYEHRLFDLDWRNPWVWLAIFVGRDFVYYWIHRAEHRVR